MVSGREETRLRPCGSGNRLQGKGLYGYEERITAGCPGGHSFCCYTKKKGNTEEASAFKGCPAAAGLARFGARIAIRRALDFSCLWTCRLPREGELYQLTEWSAQESGEAAVLGTETEADAKTGSASDAENVAKTDGVSEKLGVGKMDSASETAVSGETAAANLFVHVCGEVRSRGFMSCLLTPGSAMPWKRREDSRRRLRRKR